MNEFRDIYVIPHSHFDYGYTHPQRMLLELQKDYLSEAIRLCLATRENSPESQFKWTIEANYILTEWLWDATDQQVEDLRQCLAEGRIAITALPYHTTPLSNLPEQTDLFETLKQIRELFGYEVRTAINHDINGQPWSLQQLLRQAGVDFYLTGINVHFGGLPFERPQPFLWEGPDKEHLTCFLGEHYSLFSQFTHSERIPHMLAAGDSAATIYESMREDLEVYENALRTRSWPKPFYVLTATNPPLYDNNSPDSFLPEAVRLFNETSPDQKIHIITVDELRALVYEHWQSETLPVHRGDWTDFWNFGAGSTPAEIRVHHRNQGLIQAAEWLNTLETPQERTVRTLTEAKELNLLFAEHTWGASESITDPGADMTRSQRTHKDHLVWDAASLAAYSLGTALETVNGEPGNFSLAEEDAAVTFYNPTPYSQTVTGITHDLDPEGTDTSLTALRIKECLPFGQAPARAITPLEVPAFSRRTVKLAELRQMLESRADLAAAEAAGFRLNAGTGEVETPDYSLRLDPASGRITEITNKTTGRSIEGGEHGFASVIRETLAEGQENKRSTFFPRDVMLGNLSQSVWNHEWIARRETPSALKDLSLDVHGGQAVLTRRWSDEIGAAEIAVSLTFGSGSDNIDIDVRLDVVTPDSPVSYYLAVPTDLGADWTGRFDTAGVPVRLDSDQMDGVSKDWVSLDSYYAADDGSHGWLLASPDARLLQPDGFGFGRESKTIKREAKPLILAWLCNNYWDTNFNARIAGKLDYHFSLRPYTDFDPAEAAKAGTEALNPVVSGLTRAGGSDGDKTWYRWKSDHTALQLLRPDGEDLILAVRNLSLDKPADFTFGTAVHQFEGAQRIRPTGESLGDLNYEPDKLTMTLEPGELAFVRLIRKTADHSGLQADHTDDASTADSETDDSERR